jgi:hypothetical protein
MAASTHRRRVAQAQKLFIHCAVAPLHCDMSQSLSFATILPRMARMKVIESETIPNP